MNKLNLGCGKNIKEGWINVDCMELPGVDVVWNWGVGELIPNFSHDVIDEVYCSHVLEHIPNALQAMQELHWLCKDGAKAVFRVPYGSSDNAWEDPTHVRPYFLRSFAYFSQMMYGAADYGYRGDWEVEEIKLLVPESKHDKDINVILAKIESQRNIVTEMIVTMRCVKPIRTASKDPGPGAQFKLMIDTIEG